jgi:ligand-binding sensor domain-containing protein
MSLETGASLKEVVDKAEQIDSDLQNKKQLIATAVTGKDVPTNGSDSFQKMADNIDSIKTKLPILEGDVGVTEDSEGNVYGVEKIEERQVYYSTKKFSNVWSLSTNNMKIYNLIVDNEGFLYLGGSTGLYKYDKDKNKIWEYLGVNINAIAIDKENNVYVGDSTNHKLIKFDSSGNILFEKIMQGKRITSLFVTDGYIYIASADSSSGFNPELVKIDLQNNETLIYNQVYVDSMYVAKDGSIYIAHKKGLVKLDSNDSLIWEDTSIIYVDCVFIDKEGYVYISTDSEGRIQKYTSDGVVVWTNSGLSYLQDITLDEFGYIYSCCTNSAGLKKHNKNSDLELSGGGSFSKVDVDNFGNIYLLSGTSVEAVYRYKDNYTIEKVAVLKEREVQ